MRSITIFCGSKDGSDPRYLQHARELGRLLAGCGVRIVFGGGRKGLMGALADGVLEGGGLVTGIIPRVLLEWEVQHTGLSELIITESMHERKTLLFRMCDAAIVLPGGYGTLDEMFELLTLTQTGKGMPVPIVLLDVPGDPYWETVDDFVREQLVARGLVSPADRHLYLITDSVEVAVDEITGFYRNFHSMRYVGDTLVIRLQQAPTDEQLTMLNTQFDHLCKGCTITRVAAFPPEVRDDDNVALPRIGFTFGKHGYGDLRELIDLCNTFVDG